MLFIIPVPASCAPAGTQTPCLPITLQAGITDRSLFQWLPSISFLFLLFVAAILLPVHNPEASAMLVGSDDGFSSQANASGPGPKERNHAVPARAGKGALGF